MKIGKRVKRNETVKAVSFSFFFEIIGIGSLGKSGERLLSKKVKQIKYMSKRRDAKRGKTRR